MVSGAGSGGVERIGGAGVDRVVARAGERGRVDEPVLRQRLARLDAEERIRQWTNRRVRTDRNRAALTSVGKVHQATLNQAIQLLAVDVLGADAMAWDARGDGLPLEVRGMLRSRANTIEGGTSEVNRNVVGERVLGLPREPDPWDGVPWEQVPRS